MTCLDQPMIRRDRWRAVLLSAFAVFAGIVAGFFRRQDERVEDLNDHMLRDIGFADGRETEAGMQRAAQCQARIDRF